MPKIMQEKIRARNIKFLNILKDLSKANQN